MGREAAGMTVVGSEGERVIGGHGLQTIGFYNALYLIGPKSWSPSDAKECYICLALGGGEGAGGEHNSLSWGLIAYRGVGKREVHLTGRF